MLGIVLVNYKTEDKTVEYVRTELSKIQSDYKLVIVNNSCTEQSNIKLAEGCKAEIVTDIIADAGIRINKCHREKYFVKR